jgi:hypothetical protein
LQKPPYKNILRSFIWGNTNSLERYEVSAKANNVNKDCWEKIKTASKIFDSAKYILDTCSPNILIITNWQQEESWLVGNNTCEHKVLDDHLWYYYLPNSNTHVYWLAHPGWLARNGKFESSITTIINDLNSKGINASLADSYIANKIPQEENQIIDKHEYIGKLAQFLSSTKTVMSGFELAELLNRNNFKTSYGTEYAGTRGTYKLISDCYDYFKNINKQNIADAIASAFVKEDGNFAYE